VEATTEEEVKANWEKIKLTEGKKSVLSGVPKSLPAMVKATRIQEKVRGIGFDWERAEDVWNKVEEEIQELKVEVLNTSDKIEAEFGDVLFALINYARFIGVQPENALASTNTKFMKRFVRMEELIASSGKDISSLNLGEMDVYWEEAKKMER